MPLFRGGSFRLNGNIRNSSDNDCVICASFFLCLGFKGKQSGLVTRPDMPNAALTIHYLQQYILSIGEAKSAHLPLQRLKGGETIDFPRPDEISAEDRYKNYMKLVKRPRRSG